MRPPCISRLFPFCPVGPRSAAALLVHAPISDAGILFYPLALLFLLSFFLVSIGLLGIPLWKRSRARVLAEKSARIGSVRTCERSQRQITESTCWLINRLSPRLVNFSTMNPPQCRLLYAIYIMPQFLNFNGIYFKEYGTLFFRKNLDYLRKLFYVIY